MNIMNVKTCPGSWEILRGGQSVALVTDAGSPSISDPGYLLVRGVVEEDIPFTSIPGPTAVISAVVPFRSARPQFHFSRISSP